MDRIPELYIGMLGILKRGAIAQPLFSAFMPDSLHVRLADAETRCILTTKRHVRKVRKILPELPHLEHRRPRRDFCRSPRGGGFPWTARQVESRPYPATRDAVPAALHVRHHRQAQGRAARPRLDLLPVHHHQMGARPQT
jgi:hypothetical protein